MGAKCQRYCPQAGARAGRPRRQLRGKTGSRPPPTRRTRRGGQPGGRLGPRQPLACPDRQGCLRTAGRAQLPRSPGLPTTGKRPGSGAERSRGQGGAWRVTVHGVTIPWTEEPGGLQSMGSQSHGQRSLAGYSPRGHKESDSTERLNTHTHMQLQCLSALCLSLFSFFQIIY